MAHPYSSAMANHFEKSWSRYLFLIGLAFLGLLIWHFGWKNLVDVLLGLRPVPFLAMIIIITLSFWVRAWKWRYALGSGKNSVSLFFWAKVAGNFSPGRVGELAPLLSTRHRTPQVAAWIIADRLLEILLTLLFGFLGVWLLHLISGLLAAVLACLGLLLILTGAYLIYRSDLLKPLETRLPEASRRRALATLLIQLHEETRALAPKAPNILFITAAGKILDIYVGVYLCLAFGYDVSFLLMCAARCAHALVSAIPLATDATGVPFAAAAVIIHQYAAMPYPALTVALSLEYLFINLILWLSLLLSIKLERGD